MIEYCPQEYFYNCSNAMKKCKQCAAYTRNIKDKLQYEEIERMSEEHPYLEIKQQSIKKAARNRKAKSVEKKIEKEIARGTIRSGAVNGDGDLALLNGELRVEVKDRGVRKSWNLTLEEFLKGRRQRIDIYAISIETQELGVKTLYMMEDDLFNDLLSLLKENKQDNENV